MKALGINAQFVEGDWETLNNKLASSSVDLLAVAGGTPFPALLDLGRRQQIRFIPLNRDDALKIQLQVPELARTRVPLGVYPWEQTVYPTMGLFNFIVVRSDLPDSLAAAVIEALFSDNATMLEFSPAAAETLPSNYARFPALCVGISTILRLRITETRTYLKIADRCRSDINAE
jgi:TRAP-type uncharacterized transport system substrate-binding protein